MKAIRLVIISWICCMHLAAQSPIVWQWKIDVKGGIERDSARAFLWIPENCKQVKGVVFAQHNMEEISILENPRFRKTLSDIGFAEIWCNPGFDHLFRFNQGAGDLFNRIMSELAQISGYDDLNYAPIVPIGHSAAASWPYYFAAWNPERTLAAISVSGQWPYFRSPVFAPDIWGDKTIDFVPALETMGEYEGADSWSKEGLKERMQHPSMPLSMLACPTEGHFASTDKKVDYLSLYIRKAIQYRYPHKYPRKGSVKLTPIDPKSTGWLVDKWRLNEMPKAQAAPVAEYKGDPAEAFWFFDKEMALATEEYQSAYRNMKPQLLGYVENGKVLKQSNSHLQVTLGFQPIKDGSTFVLKGTFLDTVPGESPRPAGWAQLNVGSHIGHAQKGEITIHKICGPVEQLTADTFAIHFDRSGFGFGRRDIEVPFAATHLGDKIYKPMVQQAHMFIPAYNKQGITQHIIFPKIADQKEGVKSIQLAAVSDSGLPINYYIESGPAIINGDQLLLRKIPPKSKFPIKVTVVAWQWGRSIAPLYQSAEPIKQIFYINK